MAADTLSTFITATLDDVASHQDGDVWSLPRGGDLNTNLVALAPNTSIGEHFNNDVDVLVVVLNGSLELVVDGNVEELCEHHLASIPRGALRSIVAGNNGARYLSIHRHKSPLSIGAQPEDYT